MSQLCRKTGSVFAIKALKTLNRFTKNTEHYIYIHVRDCSKWTVYITCARENIKRVQCSVQCLGKAVVLQTVQCRFSAVFWKLYC